MKKLLCMLLALVMALGLAAGIAEDEKEYYGGYTGTIDATIVVYQRSYQGAAEDIWFWDFSREYFGINFEVTQVTDSTPYKSEVFASGDMPDVFYQLFLSSGQLVEQGTVNKNLIPLEDYITPEIMPNLSRIYEAYPEFKNAITAGDGHIYALGGIGNGNAPQQYWYINQRWLDDAGLDLPTTLDEFTEVLAAFKAREQMPEYEGKTVVPLTGDLPNQPRYIAQAFGWICPNANFPYGISLDDAGGQPCFIYADEERWPEFMKIMKEYIAAGYFSADVFDSQVAGNQTNQQKADDLTGFDQGMGGAPNPNEWVVARPLTSEWNDEPTTLKSTGAINNASFAISSKCDPEKIDRLMTWVDWLYDVNNYYMSHWGPSAETETEYLYGLKSGYIATKNDEGKWSLTSQEVLDGDYTSFGDYQHRRVHAIIDNQYLGLKTDLFGELTREVNPTVYTRGEDINVLPYLTEGYPAIVFFDADTTLRTSELATEINAYVNEQYVAFITGEKEINDENLAEYFDTLKSLGYEEYVQYYIDYYNDVYLAN